MPILGLISLFGGTKNVLIMAAIGAVLMFIGYQHFTINHLRAANALLEQNVAVLTQVNNKLQQTIKSQQDIAKMVNDELEKIRAADRQAETQIIASQRRLTSPTRQAKLATVRQGDKQEILLDRFNSQFNCFLSHYGTPATETCK